MNELAPRAVAWGRDLMWMCINFPPAPHLVCLVFLTPFLRAGGVRLHLQPTPGACLGCEASTSLLT